MRFELNETQQLLRGAARDFLAAECPMTQVRAWMDTETAYDDSLWRKLAEQGWTGILFPEEYDGAGLSLVEAAVALEEMGRSLLPGPFLSTVLLAGTVIHAAGSEAQRRKYLVPICRGEARSTLALLEASASWDLEAVRLEAARTGSGYRLSGRKLFVGDAAVADFLVCAARTGSELALLMVPRGTRGLRITPMPALDLTRRLYEVVFENAEVAEEEALAVGPAAHAALAQALDTATVGLVAEMVGGMQQVLDTTVKYAKTRQQFGKPIGQFQAVQHQCADMLLWTESSRSAAYYAAWAMREGIAEAPRAVSIAKMYASDAYREVGNRGIQVHGGMGFTWENDVHLYFRRAKASEILFGDATYHRERIARLWIDAPVAAASGPAC